MTQSNKPIIYNLYKPKDKTSYDVIRSLKKLLPKKTKLGHFGTLDPFASGVLLVGVHGAQRLNEQIHEFLPKTYLAHGILGVNTPTGDMTEEPDQVDDSDYLKNQISQFDMEFIETKLKEKFIGKYLQAPHKYSAAKHEGKALHKWAREGVEIKKEKKKREIYSLRVVSYEFPKLLIEFKVSSGTYIRTLFSDCAAYLGTLGTLEDLERTEVGHCLSKNSQTQKEWNLDDLNQMEIDQVLKFHSIIFAPKEATLYQNGVLLKKERAKEIIDGEIECDYHWVRNEENTILGLARILEDQIQIVANFSSNS